MSYQKNAFTRKCLREKKLWPLQENYEMSSLQSFENALQENYEMSSLQSFENALQENYEMSSLQSFENALQENFENVFVTKI